MLLLEIQIDNNILEANGATKALAWPCYAQTIWFTGAQGRTKNVRNKNWHNDAIKMKFRSVLSVWYRDFGQRSKGCFPTFNALLGLTSRDRTLNELKYIDIETASLEFNFSWKCLSNIERQMHQL